MQRCLHSENQRICLDGRAVADTSEAPRIAGLAALQGSAHRTRRPQQQSLPPLRKKPSFR